MILSKKALVATVSVLALVVASLVLLWPREHVYAGEAGLHLDAEGNLRAIIDTCGQSISSFEVKQDGELLSVFEADEPFNGVVDEVVGAKPGEVEAHPSPWLQTVATEPKLGASNVAGAGNTATESEGGGAAQEITESVITLHVRLHDAPDNWQHREAEADLYTLHKVRGERIVRGVPFKSGDQLLLTHERFSEECGEPMSSESAMLWDWLGPSENSSWGQ